MKCKKCNTEMTMLEASCIPKKICCNCYFKIKNKKYTLEGKKIWETKK